MAYDISRETVKADFFLLKSAFNVSQLSRNSGILPKTTFAPSSVSMRSGRGPVFTATVKTLADTPARTPSGAFSTTMASHGSTPAF